MYARLSCILHFIKRNFMHEVFGYSATTCVKIKCIIFAGGCWSVTHIQRTVWHGWWFKTLSGQQTQQLCCYGCFPGHHHQCVYRYIHHHWEKGVSTIIAKFTSFVTYIFLIHSIKQWNCILQPLSKLLPKHDTCFVRVWKYNST